MQRHTNTHAQHTLKPGIYMRPSTPTREFHPELFPGLPGTQMTKRLGGWAGHPKVIVSTFKRSGMIPLVREPIHDPSCSQLSLTPGNTSMPPLTILRIWPYGKRKPEHVRLSGTKMFVATKVQQRQHHTTYSNALAR